METEEIIYYHDGENMQKIWKNIDERVNKWPLLGGMDVAFTITSIYLIIVLVVGPNVMKKRNPYDLKNIIFYYNTFQVFLSMFLFYKSLTVGVPLMDFFNKICYHRLQFSTEKRLHFVSVAWWFLISKVSEFTETIFFLLRKKSNQVTFLHVYHHASSYLITYYILKFQADEYTIIMMILNSGVHVMMYTYYTLSTLGPAVQKYLWWKKYITTIQIIQFDIFIAYILMAKFSNCGYSSTGINILLANSIFLFVLFYNFYKSNYSKKQKILE